MAGFGDLLLGLRGINNPQAQMMKQILNPGPEPKVPNPAIDGEPAIGEEEPQPQAYQSPPDLTKLYTDLTNFQNRSNSIDDGITMIASAFSSPATRAALLNGLGNSGGGSGSGGMGDFNSLIKTANEMKAAQQAQADRAAMLGNKDVLAKELGITPQAADYLIRSGKLDEVMAKRMELKKPTDQIMNFEYINGERAKKGLDPVTWEQFQQMDDTPTADIQELNVANAQRAAAGQAPLTMEQWQQMKKPSEATGNMKELDRANSERVAKGMAPLSMEDWLKQAKQPDMMTNNLKELAAANDERKVQGLPPITVQDWIKSNSVTPTDDLKELAAANAERKAAGKPPISVEEWISSRNKEKVASAENAGDVELAKKFAGKLADEYDVAKGAADTMNIVNGAYKDLNKGIISGYAGAEGELAIKKAFGYAFGITDEQISNTESFKTAMQEVVLPKVKQLGTGNSISNADRDFIEKAVGANLTLNAETMKQIMGRTERMSIMKAMAYNKQVIKRMEKAKAEGRTPPDIPLVDIPEPSEALGLIVPQAHVDRLREHAGDPEVIKEFNRKYGEGMAEYFTGGYGG